MQVISYNSRIETAPEQKLSTYDQELCATSSARNELYINCSTCPITFFTDHNPFFHS